MDSREKAEKYYKVWEAEIRAATKNSMLDYQVLLYSVEQKCFHEERLIDYIVTNIVNPECEYRLVSPPFITQEENDEYCAKLQKEIKKFCDEIGDEEINNKKCWHLKVETKKVTFSNGTEHLQKQCIDCGKKLGYAPQNNPIKDEDKMFLKKHNGITYREVFEKDLDYLMWIATGDHKMEDLRVKVREYLKSKGVVIE